MLLPLFPIVNMADKLPDGFLSKVPDDFLPKPEALDNYNKPERTFQRRLAKALKDVTRDDDFLSHFCLATSDETVRKGERGNSEIPP